MAPLMVRQAAVATPMGRRPPSGLGTRLTLTAFQTSGTRPQLTQSAHRSARSCQKASGRRSSSSPQPSMPWARPRRREAEESKASASRQTSESAKAGRLGQKRVQKAGVSSAVAGALCQNELHLARAFASRGPGPTSAGISCKVGAGVTVRATQRAVRR